MSNLPTTCPNPPEAKRKPPKYRPATECVFVDSSGSGSLVPGYNASSMPIYQTATFKQTSATDMGDFDYSRSGNPTRTYIGTTTTFNAFHLKFILEIYLVLLKESHIAKLEGACRSLVVSSGMGALDVITRLVSTGDEIVAGDDLYGGTNRLLSFLRDNMNIPVHNVNTCSPGPVAAVLSPATRLVLLESPSNPLLKIADLRGIVAAVRSASPRALIVVDNTMMSPYLQRPLELGCDIVYHSGTKYLSGHHDLMAGVISVREEVLAEVRWVVGGSSSSIVSNY